MKMDLSFLAEVIYKDCRCCDKRKPIEDFTYMPSMPDKRNDVCRECVGKEEYFKKVDNQYIVDGIIYKTGLKRKDIYPYPDLIESYKYNLLIKRLK